MTSSKVYVQGSFDRFHRGHKKLLKRASKLGKLYIGVINSKAYERNRGYKPDGSDYERVQPIWKWLDKCKIRWKEISIIDNLKTKEHLLKYKPDIIVVGTDWISKDIYKQYNLTQAWLDTHNILLCYFPYTPGISSTMIKNGI